MAHRGCDFIFQVAPHKTRDNAASSRPNPPGVPRGNCPGAGPGAAAVQNVFTTIATSVPFPFSVIVFGTIWQVMSGEELVHPSITLPVVPGREVSSNPNTAPPPGVVLTVDGVPGFTVIVTEELLLLKVAVTVVAAVTVTEHPPVPLHPPPLQPANVEPSAAVAVNPTTCPLAKLAEHIGWHAIPAGALVTVPVPLPASVTVNVKFVVLLLNMAVTVVAAVNVTEHPAVPLHPAPVQPANVEPAAAVAVSATTCPLAKFATQVGWQAIPAGVLVTVPVPVPVSVTVKATFVADLVKVAVTACAAVMVTEQPAVPLQPAPLQPANVEPAAAVALSATTCPLAKFAMQVG